MHTTTTRILIVEHDNNDLEMLQYELKKSGMQYISRIVENEADYNSALRSFGPDIILSDYSLPAFDGPTAFKIKEELAPNTPFIFVSGTIGEENSIELIKNGLTDYALKDKLFTLPVKIKRALNDSKDREKKTRVNHELIQSEKRLARAQQIAHIGSWELDLISNVLVFSDEACRIYGFEPGHGGLSFETWSTLVHPEDLSFVLESMAKASDTLQDASFNHRIVLKDGTVRHIYAESRFEFDESGNAISLYGIAHDVTRLKLDEARIEFDRNNLDALINNTRDLMWSVDRSFNLITSNRPFDDLLYQRSGMIGLKGKNVLLESLPRDKLIIYQQFYERAFAGESFVETQYSANPYDYWSEISFSPIYKGTEVIGAACYLREITERKLAELERAKITGDLVQRNKSLEQFAYIVSHNLRAPVANIIGLSDVLQAQGLCANDEAKMKEHLITSIKKLDNVIADLNNILQVKLHVGDTKEIVRFSDILNDIQLSISTLLLQESVAFISDFSEAGEMHAVKSYLYSIFYNLISNSIKYRQSAVKPAISISSHWKEDKLVLLFSDNGLGIDLEKRGDQVFGLYKRFHFHAEGKGMGLYMVKTQVENMGGRISVESEVNKGTKIIIEFEPSPIDLS